MAEDTTDSPAELTVPPTAELPVEAALVLPPPTSPDAELAAQLFLAALATPAERPAEEAPAPRRIDGEKLREALRGTPEALGRAQQYSPRNVAKATVGAGIDKVLEAGGLRTPTRPQEPK